MRNTDEQLREILSRAEYIRLLRRNRAAEIGAACLCAALIIALSLVIPLAKGELAEPSGSYASLIQNAPELGYVVIGVLAFALGVCFTLLCVHLAGKREGKQDK